MRAPADSLQQGISQRIFLLQAANSAVSAQTSRFLHRSREPCRDLREFPSLPVLSSRLSSPFPIWMRPGAAIYQEILFFTVCLGRGHQLPAWRTLPKTCHHESAARTAFWGWGRPLTSARQSGEKRTRLVTPASDSKQCG